MKTTIRNWKPTCGELVRFWSEMGKDGTLNSNTATAIRSACKKVLSVLPHWNALDVRKVDQERTLDRFSKEWKEKLRAETIESYKKRFRYGLEYFLHYLKDPLSWDPGITSRSAGRIQTSYSPCVAEKDTIVEHRFPLRNDVDVLLALPRDLKAMEATRLSEFLRTLAVDAPASNKSEVAGWPPAYFEQTYGSFRDAPLERGGQGEFEKREDLE